MVVLFKMLSLSLFVLIFASLTLTVVAENEAISSTQEANCVLPPYPKHGRYNVNNYPTATPGDSYPSVKLDVSCDTGYLNNNNASSIFCINGEWFATMPTCVRFCTLRNELSVEYRCALSGSLSGSQVCESMVPEGTVVGPRCRSPNYYSSEPLAYMHCIDGVWNYNPFCSAECGKILESDPLIGTTNKELPWHAGIYSKLYQPYMQICGGSLINPTTVISAAHCFWNDVSNLLPASNYAVAVGKMYRPYNDRRDINNQQSDVVDIKIPNRFRGAVTNYQDDIALVLVATPFVYQSSVRPVCLNFDYNLDKIQLKDGNFGKAAGWNNARKNEMSSPVLKIKNLPYMKFEDCYNISPPSFREYLTSDKFCAGFNNDTSLCIGDGGAGIAFLEPKTRRYYLRGVLSVAPNNENICKLNTFTSILKHEHFIKESLS